MNKKFGLIFGGVIAFILLMLYAVTVIYMIVEVLVHGSISSNIPYEFPEGLVYVTTTIGGLVSALVIAKLTITKPESDASEIK